MAGVGAGAGGGEGVEGVSVEPPEPPPQAVTIGATSAASRLMRRSRSLNAVFDMNLPRNGVGYCAWGATQRVYVGGMYFY